LRRVLWARVWRALLLVEWGLRTSYNRVRRNARRAVIGEMGQQVEARIVGHALSVAFGAAVGVCAS
jgi:hypothetical protein